MSVDTRHLTQEITWWEYLGSDGMGGFEFASPVVIDGRWEDNQTQFRTPDNEETVSSAVVYVDRELSVGDYLYEGEALQTTNPATLKEAQQIRQLSSTTNLRQIRKIRKAFL